MFQKGISTLGLVATALMAASALTGANAAMVVSGEPTQNVSCAAGTCTATAADAVLNVKQLNRALAHGDTALVSGDQAQDIVFNVPVHWTSSHTLGVSAWRGIAINRPMQVLGDGGLSIGVSSGGSTGNLKFSWNGYITFLNTSSALTIDGNAFTLVNDIASLASAANASPSGFFALAKSYDAQGDGVYTSSPVPITLLGGFEGLGNKIDGLQMNASGVGATVGLFNVVGPSSVVDNVRLTHVKFSAGSRNGVVSDVGAIAGSNLGTISQTIVLGSVRGWNATLAGGLVGLNAGNIVHSRSGAAVTGQNAGGIAGQNAANATIHDSFATGAIRSVGNAAGITAGGIAGGNLLGTITNCYATGNVSGVRLSTLGGIVGNNTGNVSYTYAYGTIAGDQLSTVGGLAGSNLGTIAQSYSTGQVTGGGLSTIGGFIGTDLSVLPQVTAGYWNTTTSGTNTGVGNKLLGESGVTGLTTSQLQSALPNGFSTAVWSRDGSMNNSMPFLLELPPT